MHAVLILSAPAPALSKNQYRDLPTRTEAVRYDRHEACTRRRRDIRPDGRAWAKISETRFLSSRTNYAAALHNDEGATLDDLREAIKTLEDVAPTARRVLGGANPLTRTIEQGLRGSRALLRAREDGRSIHFVEGEY
jgi:hypothetical protein